METKYLEILFVVISMGVGLFFATFPSIYLFDNPINPYKAPLFQSLLRILFAGVTTIGVVIFFWVLWCMFTG